MVGEWEVLLVDEVVSWFEGLMKADWESACLVEQAIDALAADGPSLGRPLVDRVHGSRLHNMKELRPGSAKASEIRILFVFDSIRRAVLLVAGDKAGNWRSWYRENIPLAEKRYEAHMTELNIREYL
ncbi:MAG TPA: type II toxin-antitoxin system RelE/ParE family toxin [Candidatus Limnocylindrales bacterium]